MPSLCETTVINLADIAQTLKQAAQQPTEAQSPWKQLRYPVLICLSVLFII